MGSQLDGHNSGNEIENQAKIHDLALEQLKECISITYNVTLIAKLYQNAELKELAFARLCEIAFDESSSKDEENPLTLNTKAAALNEVLQITQLAKNELAAKKGNKKAVLAKIENKK